MAPKEEPKREWSWKPGSRYSVPAEVAGEVLEQIREQNGGITPAAVVDEASDPDHPLHDTFCWDDSEAACKYRLAQARQLINSVRVVVRGSSPTPAFINVTIQQNVEADLSASRGYLPSAEVMASVDYRDQALEEALRALRGWEMRYRHLEELAGIMAAIDKVKKKNRKPSGNK
jgi:hypothetical protein